MTTVLPPSRRSTIVLALACAVFVVTRLWILMLAPVERSTVGVFAEMGFEYRAATSRGEPWYEFHAQRAREAARIRVQRGHAPGADPAREKVEYPPLAVAWIVLPTYFGAVGGFDAYARAFRGLNAAVDVGAFMLVWWLARRIRLDPAWPLMLYALCGLVLFHVLYDRLDLVIAALSAAAMALLVGGAHWTIAFAVLAAAVNFKVVPIVLAPAFIVGATSITDRWAIAPLVVRSLTLMAFCVAMFLPFWIVAGNGATEFLSYHADRGLQVESIPANLALLAGRVRGLSFTHGAIDIVSPGAGVLS